MPLTIDEDTRKKIARRAARALRDGETSHRITDVDVDAGTLRYRVPDRKKGPRQGPRVLVTRTADGKVEVPTSWPPTPVPTPGALDLLEDHQVKQKLPSHRGRVRAYKLTKADGTGPHYPSITYEVGETVEVSDADENPGNDCAKGINLASLEWAKREMATVNTAKRIFAVEFDAPTDLAVVPTGTDGKFRVHRALVVEEVDVAAAEGLLAKIKRKLSGG